MVMSKLEEPLPERLEAAAPREVHAAFLGGAAEPAVGVACGYTGSDFVTEEEGVMPDEF